MILFEEVRHTNTEHDVTLQLSNKETYEKGRGERKRRP